MYMYKERESMVFKASCVQETIQTFLATTSRIIHSVAAQSLISLNLLLLIVGCSSV